MVVLQHDGVRGFSREQWGLGQSCVNDVYNTRNHFMAARGRGEKRLKAYCTLREKKTRNTNFTIEKYTTHACYVNVKVTTLPPPPPQPCVTHADRGVRSFRIDYVVMTTGRNTSDARTECFCGIHPLFKQRPYDARLEFVQLRRAACVPVYRTRTCGTILEFFPSTYLCLLFCTLCAPIRTIRLQ